MTTTTLADLEHMGGSAGLRETLANYLVSAIAQRHPDMRQACLSYLVANDLPPLRGSLDATLLAAPGTGAETTLKQVARDLSERLGARIDYFSADASGNALGQAWAMERFGEDTGKGLEVGVLNDLSDEAVSRLRDQHPEALLIRRYYRMDADVVEKLARQEQVAMGAVLPVGQMHPELRRACQLCGFEANDNRAHPVVLLNEQRPALAALYLAARAEDLPAPPASVQGSINDPEALRQAALTHDSSAGKMLARQLSRACPGLGHTLAALGDTSPADIRQQLVAALNQEGAYIPEAPGPGLAEYLAHEAYHWHQRRLRVSR